VWMELSEIRLDWCERSRLLFEGDGRMSGDDETCEPSIRANSERRLRGVTMIVFSIFQDSLKGGSVRCHNFEAVWSTLYRTITYMAVAPSQT
jgi:hypothetical protein